MSESPVYTIEIVTERWPKDRRTTYLVVNHKIDQTQLALHFPDGGMAVICDLDRTKVNIYPDYQEARKIHLQREKEQTVLEELMETPQEEE